jgi:hypothetical protein
MSRLALLAGLVVTLALVPQASGRVAAAKLPAGPSGLRAFVLRADEPIESNHTYAEMPAFEWNFVNGASQYQLQLSDNESFSDISILYQKSGLHAPVASIQMQLPWMNGNPYALWVRVRAVVNGYTTPWGKPFGFNMSWQNVPQQEPAPTGLVRWTPVEGATEYEVWYTNINRAFMTYTNVADEREYWTLHPSDARKIQWRVRAVRTTTNATLPSGIAITPYGPWSDVFTTLTPASIPTGKLADGTTVSDVSSIGPHALMPGFAWNGTNGSEPAAIGDQLWRVYVFSDKACVNQVMVGSMTGSPAWAPRAAQSLAFPGDSVTLAKDEGGLILSYGAEGSTFSADDETVTASEDAAAAASSSSSSTSSSTSSSSAASTSASGSDFSGTAGAVQLPDSGWPTGRYWWTVVPVQIVQVATSSSSSSSSGSSGSSGSSQPSFSLEYHDSELPQDACKSGREWSFGLQSAPVTTAAASTPYVSGVTAGPRVIAAATRVPNFTELPIITWEPAIGAQSYEVQLSRHLYPWDPVSEQTSVVTSASLPLNSTDRGIWYYRVRGVNPTLPANAQKMTWSSTVELRITGNQFKIVK